MLNKTKLTSYCLLLVSPFISNANIASSMGDFFKGSSYMNTTSGKVVHAQEANYITAGNAQIKTPSENIQIARIQLPSIQAGCGGINLFTGGFSFISKDEFVKIGKSIVQMAPAFGVNMALTYLDPAMKENLKELQDVIQKINEFNMSSCEAAEAILNGVSASFGDKESQQFMCKSYGTSINKFSDWLSSRDACSNTDTAMDMIDKADKAGKNPSLVKQNRNITWYILKKDHMLSSDTQIDELIMSIVGTYIYGPKLESGTPITPLNVKDIEQAIMDGGKVDFYHCNDASDPTEDQCLTVTKQSVDIKVSDAFKTKVKNNIDALYSALINGESIDKNQNLLDFVDATGFPIIPEMKANLKLGEDPGVDGLIDVVSANMLRSYLQMLIDNLAQAFSNAGSDGSSDELEKIVKAAKVAKSDMDKQYYEALERYNMQQQAMISAINKRNFAMAQTLSESSN